MNAQAYAPEETIPSPHIETTSLNTHSVDDNNQQVNQDGYANLGDQENNYENNDNYENYQQYSDPNNQINQEDQRNQEDEANYNNQTSLQYENQFAETIPIEEVEQRQGRSLQTPSRSQQQSRSHSRQSSRHSNRQSNQQYNQQYDNNNQASDERLQLVFGSTVANPSGQVPTTYNPFPRSQPPPTKSRSRLPDRVHGYHGDFDTPGPGTYMPPDQWNRRSFSSTASMGKPSNSRQSKFFTNIHPKILFNTCSSPFSMIYL